MPESVILQGIMWYVIFVFSTVCHEFAHAWSSYKLGDDTAQQYMTLNPVPHITRSPFGMVIIPIIAFALSLDNGSPWMVGFASVPVSVRWAVSYPKKYALSSLAGPLANVLLSVVGILLMLLMGYLGLDGSDTSGATDVGNFASAAGYVVYILFFLNLVLAVFNLLPIPPMDGSHLPLLIMPRSHVEPYLQIIWSNTVALIGIFIAWRVFGGVFAKVMLGISYILQLFL